MQSGFLLFFKLGIESDPGSCIYYYWWPAEKAKYNPMVLPYLNDHHNMTFIEVLLMKGEKIVIPAVLGGDMLTYDNTNDRDMLTSRMTLNKWSGNVKNALDIFCWSQVNLLKHTTYHSQVGSDLFDYSDQQDIVLADYVEILQLQAKFQTAMVECSRFSWITNSSGHRRVWTANLLHVK